MTGNPRPARGIPDPPPSADRPLPVWLLGAWFVTGVLLTLLAVFSIRRDERENREEWQSRLSGLADDRLALAERVIGEWREEAHLFGRLDDVREVLRVPAAARASAVDLVAATHVGQELDDLAGSEPDLSVGIVDASGRMVLSSSKAEPFDGERLEPARRAVSERHGVLGHPVSAHGDALTLEIAEPILGDDGAAVGSVLFVVDAAAALGHHFARTTVRPPERLFIVVAEPGSILVVAPEWQGEPGAAFRLPPGDDGSFANAALAAPRIAGEFSDGRGHRVLAASRRIPGLLWAIVVEVDRADALGPRREQSFWIVLAAAGIFSAVTGLGLAWRRSVRLRHYQQLSDRDARYRALLEQTQEAVAVSVEGKVAYANPACVDMFQYERALIGVPFSIFFAPGSREQVAEMVQHRIERREAPELYEAVGLRANGSTFDVEIRLSPIQFEGRAGSQAILRDITERKRMEAELRGSEQRYRLLFERNLAGVYRSTASGRMLECNRAFAHMMGYASPAEVLAQPAAAFHPNALGREQFLARLRREGSLLNFESQARRKDGQLVSIIENVSLLSSDDAEDGILLGTVFDVTERLKLEEQLLQSQKMEAVGRLAGGIAHDFNNLLTAVAGYTELLIGQLSEGDPRRESAEEIRKAGNRAAALTHQLLAFSRRQVLEPRVLDLSAVIASMEKMLRRVIGEDIELTTSLHAGLWRTRADPAQIEQAILNLVVNARDAMPRGGQLTLETANVELDARNAAVQPGPHVMLAVSDTGVGMDAEQQARLFEPFFTTKGPGRGTGLGLSMTYGVVKQSGGSIWVYSEPGHGSTFKVFLPRCEDPLDAAPAALPQTAPAKGSEVVLLVEDDAEVRRLVEKLLRLQGYTVLAATNPAEAIALARGQAGRIDILVTDVVMPGMSGRELARVLAESRPSMKVLTMSGYADAAMAKQGLLEPGTAFLSKPFTPDALARKMREVLDAPAPS